MEREIANIDQQIQEIANDILQTKPDLYVSDLVDDQGHQYIDLVMEGGGMLGIALLGYIYLLEKLNIRFRGIGGTSAGAITAILLASCGPAHIVKSKILLEELLAKNFYDFIDGDHDVKDFLDSSLRPQHKLKSWKVGFKALQVLDNIRDDLGLNPGKNFRDWIEEILKRHNINNLADLQKHLDTPITQLKDKTGKPVRALETYPGIRLALIAADVTTSTKVEFPEMAELYWQQPESISPAEFVRASMSIPLFFHPYIVKNIPRSHRVLEIWRKYSPFKPQSITHIPENITFMDGGVMSNFPINIFHQVNNIPQSPTFGVKLGLDGQIAATDKPLKLLGALFNSARSTLDYDFIKQNPDYSHLLTYIDIPKKFNWLDFNMSLDLKKELIILGAEAAKNFILTFDWPKYKDIRSELAKANIASDKLNESVQEEL